MKRAGAFCSRLFLLLDKSIKGEISLFLSVYGSILRGIMLGRYLSTLPDAWTRSETA